MSSAERVRARRKLDARDAAVAATPALVFVPFALLRYVDGDEGDYLIASQLVADGKLPYRDFLYTQTPLLPYVYGGWTEIAGADWHAARLLASVFAAGVAALVYVHVASRVGRVAGAIAAALVTSSTLAVAWYTPVKTQGLSTFLAVAAFVAASRATSRSWVVAGVLLGLAVDVRLLLAGAVPAFVWEAWRARRAGPFGGGLVLGLLFCLPFALVDARRFAFGNLGYHAERSEGGLVGDFEQKARVIANLLGIGTPDGGMPQFLLLLALAVVGAGLTFQRTRRLPFAVLVAVGLGVASLAPTPAYTQYFATLVPFLAIAAVEGFAPVALAARRRRAVVFAAAVVAVAYAVPFFNAVNVYAHLHRTESLGNVERVAAAVDAHARADEAVLATWPGYLYGTRVQPVAGLENAYAPHEAAAVSDADARRYRLLTAGEIESMIRARRVRLVVVKRWHALPPVPEWELALRDGRYRVVARVDAGSNIEPAPPVRLYEASR